MDVPVLTAKAALAVMLLVAGSAKLADLASFAAAVRLLLPRPARPAGVQAVALVVSAGELVLGAASLSLPAVGWLNPAVFVLACGFVVVSAAGYVFHRDRSCRCFGALSSRRFSAWGIAGSAAVAGAAGLAMTAVPAAAVAVGAGVRVLLLLAGSLVAGAAFSAAHALGLARRPELEAP